MNNILKGLSLKTPIRYDNYPSRSWWDVFHASEHRIIDADDRRRDLIEAEYRASQCHDRYKNADEKILTCPYLAECIRIMVHLPVRNLNRIIPTMRRWNLFWHGFEACYESITRQYKNRTMSAMLTKIVGQKNRVSAEPYRTWSDFFVQHINNTIKISNIPNRIESRVC